MSGKPKKSWASVKKKLKDAVERTHPLSPAPHEILDAAHFTPRSDLEGKVEAARQMQTIVERMRSCKSANDVFSEFARDAAMGKVTEMTLAESSDDRQRAMETVLDRALGKAVDRTMNIDVKVANMNDLELIHDIKDLLISLGFASSDGEAGKIIDAVASTAGHEEAGLIQAEPGISGELRQEPEANPVCVRGEPVSSEGNTGDDIEGADPDRELESW